MQGAGLAFLTKFAWIAGFITELRLFFATAVFHDRVINTRLYLHRT